MTRRLIVPSIIVLAAISFAFGFGKNKVQYQYMNWSVLESERYRLYYHQDIGDLPGMAYVWLDDMYEDLSGRFGFEHDRPVPVILYGSPGLFEQTNIITELLPEEVGGFTEFFKTRVALPFNGSPHDLRRVLHHEMVHAFVFGSIYGGSVFRAASAQVPLWFNEGLAELLSIGGWDRESDMYMLDRVLHSNVPPPGHGLSQGYVAYKGGQSFLYYLYCVGGDSLFNAMLAEVRKTRSAERAIETVYERSLEDIGKDWITELRRNYWPEIGRRMEPSSHASPVTASAKDRSRFNLRPRISPDGSRIAFYSDRRDYTRIIVTDTTGKELRRIRRHGFGASFESFQASSGALAWSPDGDRIAFVAKKGGRNDIRVVDSKTGRQREAIELPLAAITGLDWSRDGGRLALTGIERGRAGLYIYDMETRELTELDGSPAVKAFPRFSPDGKTIVYTVTDTSGLRSAPFRIPPPAPNVTNAPDQTPVRVFVQRPSSNLAVFDIDKKESRLLTDNTWNDKQAAFSPDGKSIVFVSDRNGVDNLYIAGIDEPDEARPLTDYTGSAGNPDWAADGSAIVYDNFLNQAWNVWYMADPADKLLEDEALALTRWAVHEESGGAMPFFRRKGSAREEVGIHASDIIDTAEIDVGYKVPTITTVGGDIVLAAFDYPPPEKAVAETVIDTDNADDGAEIGSGMDIDSSAVGRLHVDIPDPRPYRLRFTPDLVMFGLGVSGAYSGVSVAGQALVAFSDLMGDHRITFIGDIQADFSDYAQVYGAYEYLKLRVNLAAGGFYYKYYSYDGSLNNRYFHDMETGGFLGASYPFSMFSRLDGRISGRHMRREPLEDDRFVLENNALIGTFGYSFDNILWGITGPLTGFRARAQMHVAPPLSFTDEAYLSGDVDIRHYTHINRRYVWANRVMFGATVGLDGFRAARRFFLGGNDNWFNYGVNMDNYDENISHSYYSSIITPLRGWDYFDAAGDKVVLANTEFRFPFIREISTVWPIPLNIRYINGALFTDAGYAWATDEFFPPRLLAGYGFGMRANLGIFVLRYDRGWPTDFKGGAGGPTNYFSLGAEF